MGEGKLEAGTYRLVFHAGAYYQALHTETFYSEIPVIFEVRDPSAITTCRSCSARSATPHIVAVEAPARSFAAPCASKAGNFSVNYGGRDFSPDVECNGLAGFSPEAEASA